MMSANGKGPDAPATSHVTPSSATTPASMKGRSTSPGISGPTEGKADKSAHDAHKDNRSPTSKAHQTSGVAIDVIQEDRLLVSHCLAGSQEAFRQFVERFEGLVFGVCLRMLADRHEAEDVAQETFTRAFRGLKGWDPQQPLRPWIVTIAANRCRTQLEKRKRRPVGTPFAEDVADHRPVGDEANELQQEISRGLQGLRDEYRQVFLLYHEQGLSYDDMSTVMQKPVGTLKTWLHRARKELMQHLKRRHVVPEVYHDQNEH